MENKKLLNYLLKDLTELQEMFTEEDKNSFDEFEIEFIKNRISGAIKLVQMYIEHVSESKDDKQVFLSQQKSRLHIDDVHDFIASKQKDEEIGDIHTKGNNKGVTQSETIPEVVKEKKVAEVIKEAEVEGEKSEVVGDRISASVLEKEITKDDVSETMVEVIVAEEKASVVQPPLEAREKEIQFEEEEPVETQSKRLADTFQKEKSVNDLMSDDSSKLEHKLSNRPVASIHSAIGINDRFQYIRELFEGSTDNFVKAVSDLDSMSDIKEAVDYLQNNFKWKKNETSLKFVNLIKRRFPHE